MSDARVDFLRWLYPEGPWALTVIDQMQQEPVKGRTFRPDTIPDMLRWIDDWNGRHWNVYYHVNELTRDDVSKASRDEIRAMRFLHVDVDPRIKDGSIDDAEHLAKEKTRILALLREKLPSSIPPPSGLVDSGGGINALWRLSTPVDIATDGLGPKEIEARYEEAKRYNLQLEITLGGDNCHNIDRILRLPGTTNWPNKKKLAKGRKSVLATIVELTDRIYSVEKFVAAQPIQSKGAGGTMLSSGITVQVSGNVKRLEHVGELGEGVSDRLKMIIVQGFDPDEPNKFGTSRSEWLFYVCCGLVRAGVSDEQIYAVITDPGFLISVSVLDKGSGTERYALRQIQRAREDAVHPMLRALNEKHAVIGNTGGKCRIVEEVMDHDLDRPQLTMQSFEDFRNRYMAEKIATGTNEKTGQSTFTPMGAWWLQNPKRRQYESLVFVPGREVPNAYNMWRGFACEAKPGDRHLSFLRHTLEVVCNGEQVYYDYLIKWMARAVQQPDSQGLVAVVFRGDMGVGKGTVASQFGKLWGRHFLQISDPKHLVGSFNAHLRDAVIVFADEAFYAGDKKHESILKTMITEDRLAIEGKGRDVVTSRNYVHLMMASNGQWVIPAGINERRYLVLDVIPSRMRDRTYFDALYNEMDNGGRENLLHYLLTLDLKDFQVRNVPATEGLREQKILTMSTEQEWWYQKLENGSLLRHHLGWNAPVFKDDLVDDYLSYAQKIGVQRRGTATSLGRFIQSVCPPGYPRSRQRSKQYQNKEGVRVVERAYSYEFPSLGECRGWFDKKFGGPYPWPAEESEPNGSQPQPEVF